MEAGRENEDANLFNYKISAKDYDLLQKVKQQEAAMARPQLGFQQQQMEPNVEEEPDNQEMIDTSQTMLRSQTNFKQGGLEFSPPKLRKVSPAKSPIRRRRRTPSKF